MSQHNDPNRSRQRHHRFEQLEDRIVFSADGLLFANIDLADQPDERQQPVEIRPLAESTHQRPGLEYVVGEYELDGAGQTVAVIDSGIAWDHSAFGNGFGGDNRVVGGWDFAENDADPYDDSPAGSHGTLVAGIVGSNSQQYPGVAPGADLVALRVFDDQGGGTIEWVEQALRWVHENRNSFRNPITTVNLSLGVEWNADNTPNWATLEDEFSRLADDGIFISVAAGNSFQRYQSVGVSYPAASPYVVPVASYDADGNLSDFSQRNERVLVAPGNSIKSAVPGYFFGGSDSDRFVASSGTSMAAPYVAGASALVRQAYDFMGIENVDQEMIYRNFQETADKIYDSVTRLSYDRINLARAIDTLITDRYADDRLGAFDLGSLGASTNTINGIMGGKSDVDWFSFRANSSGEAIIDFSSVDNIDSSFNVAGTNFSANDGQLRFQVEAGQEYRFSVQSSAALGNYQLEARISQAKPAEELGLITASRIDGQQVTGDRWYQMRAGNSGVFTTQAIFSSAGAAVQIELYDSKMNLIGQGTSNGVQTRVDAEVESGDRVFLKVIGEDSQFDLNMTNLVSVADGRLQVYGTAGNDVVNVDLEAGMSFSINGVGYSFNSANFESASFEGLNGADRLQINTGDEDRTVLRNGQAVVHSAAFTLTAKNFYSIGVTGTGIRDQVVFVDSSGDESFYYSNDLSSMDSGGFRLRAVGQAATQVLFSSGNDNAAILGSSATEQLTVREYDAWFNDSERSLFVRNWNRLEVDGGGGFDLANIHDSSGQDVFELSAISANRQSALGSFTAVGFERVNAFGGEPNDQIAMIGSEGDDRLMSTEERTVLSNADSLLVSQGFATTIVDAGNSAGHDRAVIFDSTANDVVDSNFYRTRISGGGRTLVARGFDSVDVNSVNGGNDTGNLTGSTLADRFYFADSAATLTSDQYLVRLVGFGNVDVRGMNSDDLAFVSGSLGTENILATADGIQIKNANNRINLSGFGEVTIDSGGGFDIVVLEGFEATDSLFGRENYVQAILGGTQIRVNDYLWMEARAKNEQTANADLQAVDFWFELHGDWD